MEIRHRLLKPLIILFAVLIVLAAITGGVLYSVYSKDDDNNINNNDKIGIGAIASNGVECAEMGKKMFEKGGNVADVAVTTILCEGISSPQSCGLFHNFIFLELFKFFKYYFRGRRRLHSRNLHKKSRHHPNHQCP